VALTAHRFFLPDTCGTKFEMLTRIGVFILWLMHFLPLRVLVWIGNALGSLLYLLAAERRNVGRINLSLCFPDMSYAQRERILRDNFKMFIRGLIERTILFWASKERICSLIKVEGIEHFNAIKGKPTILLTPHFVGMDVAGSWISQQVDAISVYSTQKNRYLSDLLYNKRIRFRDQRIFSRQQGLRPIVKALREGKPFFYLPDQDQTVKDGAFIPFFGVPAATITALPRLAEMTKAAVVPCVTRLLPSSDGYVVTFYPAWDNYPTGDVIADTRRMNEFIEQRVLEMPEQYFWLHKRFKTRPPGEKELY
jgi:KDO2-lipid IV(A) lauroyltransferase